MARTKASVGAKLSSGKSSKARNLSAAPPPTGSPSTSGCKVAASGNAYCPRPTPPWQSPITRFFLGGAPETTETGSSSNANKQREETSDTESDQETSSRVEAMDTNGTQGDDLDCSMVSNAEERPISPDPTSHKIVEYFESSKGDLNGDLKSDPNTAKSNGTPASASKSKGKGKGKGKKTVEKPSKGDDKQSNSDEEDTLVNGSDRNLNSDVRENEANASDSDKQLNGNKESIGVTEEKENLKPKANTIKQKEGKIDLKKAEKRDLLEADENDTKRKKIA